MTIPTRASIRVTLLLGTGLLLAACGGTTAPASSPAASVAAKASAPASAAASAKPVASAAASVSAKPAASGAASAKPAASALTSKAYSFEAQDYSFNGPATIEGGLVTLQLKNTGKEPHHLQLLKFNTGVTMDQLTAAIATGDETAIFKLVSFPGGVASSIRTAMRRSSPTCLKGSTPSLASCRARTAFLISPRAWSSL